VEVLLIDPREKVLRKQLLKSNAAGMISFDYAFAAFAATGRHKAVAKVADQAIAELSLNVEEFVPERMEEGGAALARSERRAPAHTARGRGLQRAGELELVRGRRVFGSGPLRRAAVLDSAARQARNMGER
jgi:hypothetical protein